MRVPYFDLREQFAALSGEILPALERVCRNAAFILGEEVAAFEGEFAAFHGARYCVAVNSGTSALHLALLGVGARPGDEIITTPNTFYATVEAIGYTGARAVFADVNPTTGNLDPKAVARALSPRTKVILPVHLHGRPADVDAFAELAQPRGIAIVEDAAQGHGARYRGRPVGALGTAGAFSFYPTKNLGAYGEGGALLTNDERIAAFARAARHHGQSGRYRHDFPGFNYRMDGFQGAVLRVKMKYLVGWVAKRRELGELYRERLAGSRVELPTDDPRDDCAYHQFAVGVDDRDRVQRDLEARGVGSSVHYPLPLHLQKACEALGYRAGDFPHAERTCARVLCLPMYPELTREQVGYAANALVEIVGKS